MAYHFTQIILEIRTLNRVDLAFCAGDLWLDHRWNLMISVLTLLCNENWESTGLLSRNIAVMASHFDDYATHSLKENCLKNQEFIMKTRASELILFSVISSTKFIQH